MKNCPFCEKQVPDDTVTCPHCGRDQWTAHIPFAAAAGLRAAAAAQATARSARGRWRWRKGVLVLIALLVLLALGWCAYSFR
jgi:uncharacterized membrane protein YvbJ